MIRRRYTRTLASLLVLAVLAFAPAQAAAGERLIVRTSGLLDLPILKSVCKLVGCNVLYGLDGTLGKLVLVQIPDGLSVPLVINVLGLASIAADVTPELAREAIASIQVLGTLQASPAVRAALADRMR